MAIQWSDFPSGQPGIYGTSTSNMQDGTPWVNVNPLSAIVADPDSANFPNGLVLRHGAGANGPGDATRLALTTPDAEVGVEFRYYSSTISSDTRSFITLNSPSNTVTYNLRILANGSIKLYRDNTEIADSVSPIIFAASWTHIGFKANVVTGEVEVRKNGTAIAALTLTDGAPPGGTIGIVGFPERSPGGGSFANMYSKDIVVWNSLGTEINDFQGTVAVYDLYPDGDQSLGGWTLSSGTTGYTLVDETTPNDTDYVYSTVPPTSPIEFSFTNLPADITSVRAITMIMRAFNSDSGDGEIEMTASPDGGTSNDVGVQHFLTVTPTYFWDHSTLSPATAAAWTPTEVNSLTVSYDRTL